MTECAHERGHITDSMFYGDRYATPASREIFCDVCRHQRWLDVEAALAAAQGELGMIPAEAAAGIVAAARIELLDLAAVRDGINRSGHSLVGLLRVFQAACPDGTGEFVHLGATTQDIQDTGQALEIRDVLDEMDVLVRRAVTRISTLAEDHAATIALGRTHAQPALPIGFGLKPAGWLDELLRHAERLAELRPRVVVAQLAGGAGTMAGFGSQGLELLDRFAHRLGLGVPALGWHVARDRVAEFASAMAMLAGTAARIAEEVRVLSRPEFAEVSEAWYHGKVGSSTMPHKRNPERCEQVVVMARLAAAQAGLALTGMVGDHERDSRSLRIEWACVPDVSHYALSAMTIITEVLDGLTVHDDRCRQNVRRVADQVASERLMLALGRHLGKQTAHERVYELSQDAHDRDVPLRELLAADSELSGLLAPEETALIFEPAGYLGASVELTHRTVGAARKWLAEQPAGGR